MRFVFNFGLKVCGFIVLLALLANIVSHNTLFSGLNGQATYNLWGSSTSVSNDHGGQDGQTIFLPEATSTTKDAAPPATQTQSRPSSHSVNSSSGPASDQSSTLTRLPHVISFNSDVSPGDYASISIQTQPGASASIEVDYSSGPSRAHGLDPQVADSSGVITWTWKVGTRTYAGDWPVVITVNGSTITKYLHVE